MSLIYLEYYVTSRGVNPVVEYIKRIDDMDEAADILETLDSIDRFGAKHLVDGGEVTRTLGNGLWGRRE